MYYKKNIYLLVFMSLVLFSCETNTSGENGMVEENYSSSKKGIAYTNKNPNWPTKAKELGASWIYSWGHEIHEDLPDEIEFVPMFWGKNSVNDEVIAKLKKYKKENRIQYILGFNEPDGNKQANMSVEEVIELWLKLESVGLPLGSPAAIHADREWMQNFMHKADSLNLRVDFVTVHHYGGANVEAFVEKLKKIHEMYNRPLWITELGVGDWKAKTIEDNRHSPEKVANFIEELLPVLDTLDFVHRYAWFDGGNNFPALVTSKLFDEELNLTEPGRKYAEFK